MGSYLLCFVAGLSGRVIGVLDVGMGAGSVRMLQENMKVSIAIHQDFIFDDTSFFKILQLLERHVFVVEFENSL